MNSGPVVAISGFAMDPRTSDKPTTREDLPSWTALDVSDNSDDEPDELNPGASPDTNLRHSILPAGQLNGYNSNGKQRHVSYNPTSTPLLLPLANSSRSRTPPFNTRQSLPPPLLKKTKLATTTREPLFLPEDPSPTESSGTNGFPFGPAPSSTGLNAFSSLPTGSPSHTPNISTPCHTPNARPTTKGSPKITNTSKPGMRHSLLGVIITKPPPHTKTLSSSESGAAKRQSNADSVIRVDVSSDTGRESDITKTPRSTTPSTSRFRRTTSSLGDVTNNKPNSKLGRKGGGSSFIGVVITKPAPSASKPKITSPVDGLAAALSRAFIQNENALTSAGMTSIPVNRVRPHQPREAKHATTARTARLALATRSITQLDIDAFLGTGTGNAALPQQGGKYGQERWEKEIVERTDTNLMFLKRDLKAILGQPCGQEDAEVHTRAYAIEAKSRTEKFVDYLEMMFGPGDIHRGWGSKPQQKRRNGVKAPLEPNSGGSRGGSATNEEIETDKLMRKRPRDDDGDDDGQGHKRAKLQVDGSIAVMHVDAGWTSALQRLIKGKASMDEEDLTELSNVLDAIDAAKDDLANEVLEKTRLADIMRQLSLMSEGEIPFGDAGGLRGRAEKISEFWQSRIN